MKRLYGIVTPMVTPFNRDGQVDWKALADLTDYLLAGGVHALYPLGTTGEAAFMTVRERQEVAEAVVERVQGRVPVFVQVGAIPTADAVALARHAVQIGADGIAAVTPYYFRYSDEELVAYFEAIARSVPEDVPIYLYNIPSHTGNDLKPATVARLAQAFPNVIGIKNSMGDLDRLRAYRRTREDFSVLVGGDSLLAAAYLEGCDGAVSGPSQLAPKVYVSLFAALEAGDFGTAAVLQRRVSTICEVAGFGHVPTIKGLMRAMGLPGGWVRAPFQEVASDHVDAASRKLKGLLA